MAPRSDDQVVVETVETVDTEQPQGDAAIKAVGAIKEVGQVEKTANDDDSKVESPETLAPEEEEKSTTENASIDMTVEQPDTETNQTACFDFDFMDMCCGPRIQRDCDHCGQPILSGQQFVHKDGEYIHTDFCEGDMEIAKQKHYALEKLRREEEMKLQERREAAEHKSAALVELVTTEQSKAVARNRKKLCLEELARKKQMQAEAAARKKAFEEARAARELEAKQRGLDEPTAPKKKKGFWARLFSGCGCKNTSAVEQSTVAQ